ncbi:MAG: hypothetical protein RMJ33_11725 [Saprospiraceae bacterium]|nr:hypothetical protein [Saprospiraceae bacterium]MDW8230499.1 hypothetical protein [Saprospiraceae bacterium]
METWLLPAWAIGSVAVAMALLGFEAALRALSPGVYARSRYLYMSIALVLSPVFWAAVRQAPALLGAVGLVLWSVAFFARSMDSGQGGWVLAFVSAGVLASWLMPSLLFVLAPLAVVLLSEHSRWRWVVVAGMVVGAAGWVWGAGNGVLSGPAGLTAWSLRYFFIKPDGTPNAALLWQPLVHPFFCLPLPGLLLLFKKTDVGLYARRALTFSMTALMLYFSGLYALTPLQLLPIYALLLLLLFPAWDRFFAYGSYFFPRLTRGLLAAAVAIQLMALIFFHT